MERLKQSLLTIQNSPSRVQVTLEKESLPDETKQLVSTGREDSIVYYAKDFGMHAN